MTRVFSVDGRDYEIDLCERHSQKFDEVFRRFAVRARRATHRVGRAKQRTAAHRKRSADIRGWAKDNDVSVSDRGRIPANRIGIEIEAALAFGTGHHGTTRGCLLALDRICKSWSKQDPVTRHPEV